jgi:Cohesin domain
MRSILLISIAALATSQPAAAAGASLYLQPAQASYQTGATFRIDIRLNAAGENVNAVQADLTYPPNLLEFSSVDTSGSAFTLDAVVKGGDGKVQIARGKIGGLTGDVLVATVVFKATHAGTAKIGLSTTSAAPRSEGSSDALTSRQGATVTVTGPAVAGGKAPKTTATFASPSPSPSHSSIVPLNLVGNWRSPFSLALLGLFALLLLAAGALWYLHHRPGNIGKK